MRSRHRTHTPKGTSCYCSLGLQLGIFHISLRRRHDRCLAPGKHSHYTHCTLCYPLVQQLRRSLRMCSLAVLHWSLRSLHKTYTFRNHVMHPNWRDISHIRAWMAGLGSIMLSIYTLGHINRPVYQRLALWSRLCIQCNQVMSCQNTGWQRTAQAQPSKWWQ